jgi:hypothetical protein
MKVNLPKKDLVASITKVIQERRIKVVRGCENAGLFKKELKNFQLKVSASGHNTYNAAQGSHDDTIIAVGLCLWWGEKGGDPGEPVYEALDGRISFGGVYATRSYRPSEMERGQWYEDMADTGEPKGFGR